MKNKKDGNQNGDNGKICIRQLRIAKINPEDNHQLKKDLKKEKTSYLEIFQ